MWPRYREMSAAWKVCAIVEQVSATLGDVDILVNNAASGRIYPGGSLTIPDSGWQDALIRTSSRECA
jgi:NAD(P)-dependent dehydrogenase (short-subunit alcohol dehydrogenase family)